MSLNAGKNSNFSHLWSWTNIPACRGTMCKQIWRDIFEGNTYEAPVELIGKSVIVDTIHSISIIFIYFNDKYFGTAKTIDLKTKRHKSIGSIPENPGMTAIFHACILRTSKALIGNILRIGWKATLKRIAPVTMEILPNWEPSCIP